MTDPKFSRSAFSFRPGRHPAIARFEGLWSLRSRPPRPRLISCVVSSSLNELQSPVAILVDQILTAGWADPTLDQQISSLRSNDLSNYFASEFGALVVRNGSSSGGPQVYSETKAAEATQEVNSWTEKVTNGRIKRILPPMVLDKSTKLVFKNALNLKGQWGEKFDASDTQDYDFYLLDGSSVKAPFMSSMAKQLVSACDGFKVVALPLKQVQDKGRFSLNIFLPDAKDGLPTLEDMVVSQYESLKHHLPYQHVEVGDFRIPRFSFEFEASNALKDLGLVLPFSSEGGLTEMVPYGQDLYVSSKCHKSFIEVNEEGMQTAAASVSVMKKREKIDFVADHPFLFLVIEDKTGMVLFSGRVVNPLVGC
ncbi:hypothetical protein UlMin_002949 [Ulmus minor]